MPFTHQQLRIIQLTAQGKNTIEIARILQISVNTVRNHRQMLNRSLKGTGITLQDLAALSPRLLEEWLLEHEQLNGGNEEIAAIMHRGK